MASISVTPNALNPIEKGVLWIGHETPTADPIETRFAYKLEVNGQQVMSTERVTTPISGGDNIELDMKDDILGRCKTKIPMPSAAGTINDLDIICEATLIYGNITIDKSTDPLTVTKNVGSSSGPFKVINAAVNVFDSADLTAIVPKVLSYLPDEVSIFWNTRLWVWFLGGTGVTYNWVYKNGSSGTTTGSTAGYDVGIIPLHPAGIGIANPKDLVRITATLHNIGKTYTMWVECYEPKSSVASIMFLEPPGGRSTIAFHEVTGMSYNSSYNLVKKHISPQISFSEYQNNAGYAMAGKEGGGIRSFTKVMKMSDTALHWIDGFFGSSEYHLQHINTEGAYVWNKFILTGGGLQVDVNTGLGYLNCSGYLANQNIVQRGVV